MTHGQKIYQVIVIVEDGWSYVVGPNKFYDGPWRYQWEAEEFAAKLNAQMAIDHNKPDAQAMTKIKIPQGKKRKGLRRSCSCPGG